MILATALQPPRPKLWGIGGQKNGDDIVWPPAKGGIDRAAACLRYPMFVRLTGISMPKDMALPDPK